MAAGQTRDDVAGIDFEIESFSECAMGGRLQLVVICASGARMFDPDLHHARAYPKPVTEPSMMPGLMAPIV